MVLTFLVAAAFVFTGGWGGKQAAVTKTGVESQGSAAKPQVGPRGLIEGVTLVSSERASSGAIYGRFSVRVRARNAGSRDIVDGKITAVLSKNFANYPRSLPREERRLIPIARLKAGETRTFSIGDLRVDHPSLDQELIVSFVGQPGIRKIPVRASFPPGSTD